MNSYNHTIDAHEAYLTVREGMYLGWKLQGNGLFGDWQLLTITRREGYLLMVDYDRPTEEELARLARAPWNRWLTLESGRDEHGQTVQWALLKGSPSAATNATYAVTFSAPQVGV